MEEQDERAARIAALEAELAAAREEARQNYDRWVRERADLENLKKRAAREREEAVRLGNESLIRDLLPVMDNLERALRHAEAGGDGRPLIEGVALVVRAFRDVLERHGVQRIEAGGAVFDPAHTKPWRPSRAPSTRPTWASRRTSRATACTTGCCARRWSRSPRRLRGPTARPRAASRERLANPERRD